MYKATRIKQNFLEIGFEFYLYGLSTHEKY